MKRFVWSPWAPFWYPTVGITKFGAPLFRPKGHQAPMETFSSKLCLGNSTRSGAMAPDLLEFWILGLHRGLMLVVLKSWCVYCQRSSSNGCCCSCSLCCCSWCLPDGAPSPLLLLVLAWWYPVAAPGALLVVRCSSWCFFDGTLLLLLVLA